MVDAFELLFVNFFQALRKAVANMALQPEYSLPWKRCYISDLPGFASKRPRAAKERRRSSHAPRKDSAPVFEAEEEVTRGGERKMLGETRKRPARIVVPEFCAGWGSGEVVAKEERFEVDGSEYWLASKKGKKHVMEDGFGVITNINGDCKHAFFGVFDGHGGRAAVDFVSEKLGKNIIAAFAELQQGHSLEHAIRAGYLATDREFLGQGVHSGACIATVVLRDGELFAANVGDCRVVISKKGIANALTTDHRAGREDERMRIERSGGYVNFCNGVWRVHDSLAISRAIGDGSMKDWVISEPETKKLRLTPDCEFLIMASDGLWDKVTDQEAVDVVLRHKNSVKSCKELVDISCGRGCRDDITVMVVDLQSFL